MCLVCASVTVAMVAAPAARAAVQYLRAAAPPRARFPTPPVAPPVPAPPPPATPRPSHA